MPTKKARATTGKGLATDTRGNVRLVADLPRHIAVEFKVLAARRGTTQRALLERLIQDAIRGN